MLDSFVTFLIFITTIFVAYVFFNKRKSIKLPGPPQKWLFGNALQLNGQKTHILLEEWAKQYGDLYKINLMGKDIVIANSEAAIRDVILNKHEDFADRPYMYQVEHFKKDIDIAFSRYSDRWAHLKKISMIGLKQVGSGVQRLENLTMEIIQDVVRDMKNENGKEKDYWTLIHNAVANITSMMVYGERLTEQELIELVEGQQQFSKTMVTDTAEKALLNKWPFLRFFPLPFNRHLRSVHDRLYEWFDAQMTKKLENYHRGENVSALDTVIKECEAPTPGTPLVSYENLYGAARNMIGAGVTTTSSALYAFLAIMIEHQDVQHKAQAEIDEVLGGHPVCLQDKARMPYVNAMLLELLRYISHLPFSVPRAAVRDTTLLGHHIPKGTQVWTNVWHLHHDATLWEDPWQFTPDRYLDETGQVLPTDHPFRKRLLPFGAGRRVCAGEVLAKNRLFLFIVTLIQQFTFMPPTDGSTVPFDPRNYIQGLVIRPDRFKARAIKRNKPQVL